jgi:hypothetical protein
MKGGDDMSSTEIRTHLLVLAHERLVAEEIGMRPDGAYMADLEHEIAVLCGELFGRNFG